MVYSRSSTAHGFVICGGINGKTIMKQSALSGRLTILAGLIAGCALQAQAAQQNAFRETDLAADQAGMAKFTDANLVNPWGFLFKEDKLIVADNHSGVATAYNPAGHPSRLLINIPTPGAGGGPGAPTDVALNSTPKTFMTSSAGRSRASTLLFVTENGTIAGWNAALDASNAVIAVDNSAAGAIYKSAALAKTSYGPRLYAADFGRGTVEIYDKMFLLQKSFTDPDLASAGFAPFGIRNFGTNLLVTFAFKANPGDGDETPGPGLGYVDEFDRDGNMVRRLASQGTLNAPWGLSKAPRNFGKFSGALLVGNFGDGAINAYDPRSGAFLGQLNDAQGAVLHIEGLWGLAVGPGNESPFLYFTAGPGDESHGVLGILRPASKH